MGSRKILCGFEERNVAVYTLANMSDVTPTSPSNNLLHKQRSHSPQLCKIRNTVWNKNLPEVTIKKKSEHLFLLKITSVFQVIF